MLARGRARVPRARPRTMLAEKLAAVILAGGRSLRMGQPKATLVLGGDMLLAHVVRAVRALVGEIVIVAAADQVIPVDELGDSDVSTVRVVHDRIVAAGPLPAVARGLEDVNAEAAFALACDAPLVRPDVLRHLAGRLGPDDAGVVPEWNGRLQPLVAIYRPAIGAELEALAARGEARLQAVAELANVVIVPERDLRRLDPTGDSFRALNSPADLAAAERLLAARRAGAPR
jgi:molybdenum cofactor guanylyltransferase